MVAACGGSDSGTKPDGGGAPDGAVPATGCDARRGAAISASEMPGVCVDGFCTVAPWGLPGLGEVQAVSADEVWGIVNESAVARGARTAWTIERIPGLATVRALYAAGSEDVWAGGSGATGASTLVHRVNGTWQPIAEVTKAVTDLAGRRGTRDVWALTRDVLYHYDGNTWSMQPLEVAHGWGRVVVTAGGDVFLGGDGGRVGHVVGAAIEIDFAPQSESIQQLFATGPADIWAGKYHYDGAKWTAISIDLGMGMGSPVDAAWGPARDDVWLPWGHGIARWNGATCSELWTAPERAQWPKLDAVDGTADGTVYFGGGGLGWYERGAFTMHDETFLFANEVAIASDGTAWLATNRAGLGRIVGDTFSEILLSPGFFFDDISAIGTGVVAAGSAVVRMDAAGTATTLVAPADGQRFSDVYAASPNDVWLITNNGRIQRWTATDGLTTPSVISGTFNAVAGSGPSDVWFVGDGRSANTIVRWNGASFEVVDTGQPPNNAVAVAARAPDDVWIAFDTGVLAHWNGGAWTSLAPGVGRVSALAVDGPDRVWVVGHELARTTAAGIVERFHVLPDAKHVATGSSGVVMVAQFGAVWRSPSAGVGSGRLSTRLAVP